MGMNLHMAYILCVLRGLTVGRAEVDFAMSKVLYKFPKNVKTRILIAFR